MSRDVEFERLRKMGITPDPKFWMALGREREKYKDKDDLWFFGHILETIAKLDMRGDEELK